MNYHLEQMDNEVLLFNPHNQMVLYLNETASLIWQLCDGERSLPEMIELLVEAYPEAASTIPGDVERTLHQFLQKKVISIL